MSTVAIESMLSNLPDWLYVIRFNYGKLDSNSISYNSNLTLLNNNYTFFNARHRATASLFIASAKDRNCNPVDSANLPAYSGTLTVTAWSWDVLPNVKEHRLGLTRPVEFSLADYIRADIHVKFAYGNGAYVDPNNPSQWLIRKSLVFYEIEEKHFYYSSVGRLSYTLTFNRAAASVKGTDANSGEEASGLAAPVVNSFMEAVINAGNARLIDPGAPVYATSTFTYSIPGFSGFSEMPIVSVVKSTYTELSAEIHLVTQETASVDSNKELIGWQQESDLVLAPIPRIARVAALDTGKWQPISLDENPVALAARYNGWIFNNAYYNLNYQEDVGLQQIVGHADADFVYFWELENAGDFNDVRALKSALFGYMNYLAAAVCRSLKIRLVYIHYVAALIKFFETFRGVTTVDNVTQYGLHSRYPFASGVQGNYQNHLSAVFELARIDLGANDSGNTLAAYYKTHIASYNSAMSGNVRQGVELAKLGAAAASSANAKLREVFNFTVRQLTADIDSALTDAFMRDASLSGTIMLNDPAVVVNPGDSVSLNFLDDTFVNLKAMGASIDVSPEMINYSVQVKRPLNE